MFYILLLGFLSGAGCTTSSPSLRAYSTSIRQNFSDYAKVKLVASDKNSQTLKFHGQIYGYDFSPDGQLLVIATCIGKLREMEPKSPTNKVDSVLLFWNLKTQQLVRHIDFEKQQISEVHFSPDGKYIVGSLDDFFFNYNASTFLCIWDAHSGRLLKKVRLVNPFSREFGIDLAFSPHSDLLAIGGVPNTMLLNTSTWKIYKQLKSTEENLIFSPDGSQLAGITNIINTEVPFSLSVWNVVTGKRFLHFDYIHDAPSEIESVNNESISFLPDGHTLIVGEYLMDTRAPKRAPKKLLSAKSLSELNSTKYLNWGMLITKSKQWVILLCLDKSSRTKVVLWDLKSNKALYTWKKTYPPNVLTDDVGTAEASFSSDGKMAIISTDADVASNTLQIWNLPSAVHRN